MQHKPQVFIFLGPSGCGKGTQADILTEKLCQVGDKSCRTLRIGSGALLRNFSEGEGFSNKQMRQVLSNGDLAPEAIIVALWANYLINTFTGEENVIFDGCPRKLHEAIMLGSLLQFYKIEKPAVIYLNVSPEWSKKRLLARARPDDLPDAIDKRLEWFKTDVMPAINFFKSSDYYNFAEVNGEQPIDDVQNEILAKLGLNL
jgi:adenylate kinase